MLISLAAGGSAARAQTTEPAPATSSLGAVSDGPVQWRRSYAVGSTNGGFLVRGVQLPAEGEDFFTWDFPLARSPNRGWRRWGTDTTIATALRVIAEFRDAHPGAPRIGIADISRRNGGPFGRRYGGLGHASHQNGLDVDVLYPRRDRREEVATKPAQIDPALSQDLLDRFVAVGAQYVFVGPHTGLTGPRRIVQKLVYHDDHMHVRFRPRPR